MDTLELLDELQLAARHDEELKQKLCATRLSATPLSEFCRVCREYGYELYDMDIIAAGEEFHAAMARSTNGGGENSPMLESGDDLYAQFFSGLGEPY